MKKIALSFATVAIVLLSACIIYPLKYVDEDFLPYPVIVLSVHAVSGYTCIEHGHVSVCGIYILTQHICGIISINLKQYVPQPEYSLIPWIIYALTSIQASLVSVICSKRCKIFNCLEPEILQHSNELNEPNESNAPIISEIVLEEINGTQPQDIEARNGTGNEANNESGNEANNESGNEANNESRNEANNEDVNGTNIEGEDICPICLEPLHFYTHLSTTICGHVFHDECISRWLRQDRKCPVCSTLQTL